MNGLCDQELKSAKPVRAKLDARFFDTGRRSFRDEWKQRFPAGTRQFTLDDDRLSNFARTGSPT